MTGLPADAGPRLLTERLSLRLPTDADLTVVHELLGDDEVMGFLGGGAVPPEDVPAVIEKWQVRWAAYGMGPFLVERRSDGRFLGRTGILVWDVRTWTHTGVVDDPAFAQPELGWALARAAWGHGYATEAARAARAWARRERGVDRLVSVIAPANTASQGVARRLGATPGETVRLAGAGEAVVWEHPVG